MKSQQSLDLLDISQILINKQNGLRGVGLDLDNS